MLAAPATPISTPGVRVSSSDLRSLLVHDCRNPPRTTGDEHAKQCILGLNGSRDAGETGWGFGEEEEEWCGEEPRERPATGRRPGRPGRWERAAGLVGVDAEEEQECRADDGVPLSAAEVTLYRATAARANYLALDRPDLAYAAKELCRHMGSPTIRDKLSLRRLCRYLLSAPRLTYFFGWQEPAQPLKVFCDTTSQDACGRGDRLVEAVRSMDVISLSTGQPPRKLLPSAQVRLSWEG